MKKISYLILSLFIVITLASCQTGTGTEFCTLTFEEGVGTKIICEYPSGTVFEKNKRIVLEVVLDSGCAFTGWYQDDVAISYDLILYFNIVKDTHLTTQADDISKITISDLFTSTIVDYLSFNGQVYAKKHNDVLIGDDTGIIWVKQSKESNIEVGDEVTIRGKLSNSYPRYLNSDSTVSLVLRGFINDTSEKVIINENNINAFQSDEYHKTPFKLVTICQYQESSLEYYFVSGGQRFSLSAYVKLTSEYIGKSIIVEGYLLGTTQLMEESIAINKVTLEEQEIVLIGEIDKQQTSTVYKVEGIVVAVNEQAFLVRDLSSMIQVYIGANHYLTVGDYVRVSGCLTTWANQVQFGKDVVFEKLYSRVYENIVEKTINEQNLLEDYYFGQYLKFEGTLVKTSGYYNINISNSNVAFTIMYPLDASLMDGYLNQSITFLGYVVGDISNYIQIMGSLEESKGLDKLNILTLNDLHGYLVNGETDVANIAYLIKQLRAQSETILIANGDMFQGTAISNLSYGQSVLNVMNAMGFDAMGIGNHEFDWGIEKILAYFDGDTTNGEANFPLLNANIYEKANNQLLTIDNGNIFESTIVVRKGVKIGIVSYIGDVYNSISYPFVKDYYFDLGFSQSMTKIGKKLKDLGADIIIVNIHGGDTSGIENYEVNQTLASIKVDGEYIVDAIVNGHTHYLQTGYITRPDNVSIPLVQARSYGTNLGSMVLEFDPATKKIVNTTSTVYSVSQANGNYDSAIRQLINYEIGLVEPIIEENLTMALETVQYASQLQPWFGSVIKTVTNADVGLCNAGGIRSNGKITSGNPIKYKDVYEINPFDNYIIVVELTGNELYYLLQRSELFYDSGSINVSSLLTSSTMYKVAVVDYVYYQSFFPQKEDFINSGIILRDALIDDLRKRDSFKPLTNPTAIISTQNSYYLARGITLLSKTEELAWTNKKIVNVTKAMPHIYMPYMTN